MFSNIPGLPPDPTRMLWEEFQRDTRPNKVDLSQSGYFDESGFQPILSTLCGVEKLLFASPVDHRYRPATGDPRYLEATKSLVFGKESDVLSEQRIATVQTIGGTGATKLGADFLKRHFPDATVWVSDPTWEGHRYIFETAGFPVKSYPYFNKTTGELCFQEMVDALWLIPSGSVVVLQGCCHNPTGVDLLESHWKEVARILQQRNLIAFVDLAMQGLGVALQEDAEGLRHIASTQVSLLIAQSYSKNFSLNGERCGTLSVVCARPEDVMTIERQLSLIVRANYGSPPAHGANVISTVLSSPHFRSSWELELAAKRERLATMRAAAHELLTKPIPYALGARFRAQSGIFLLTGLSSYQITRLRIKHGVYLAKSGRLTMASLNENNIERVMYSIVNVLDGF